MNSPVLVSGLVAAAISLVGLGLGWVGCRRWMARWERSLIAQVEKHVLTAARAEVVAADDDKAVKQPSSLTTGPAMRVDRAEGRRPFQALASSPRAEASGDRRLEEPTLIEVPNLALQGSEQVATDSALDLARRFSSIWALEDDGEAPDAIARLLGQPVGQVELVLGLRRQLEAGVFGSASSVASAPAFPASIANRSESEGGAT